MGPEAVKYASTGAAIEGAVCECEPEFCSNPIAQVSRPTCSTRLWRHETFDPRLHLLLVHFSASGLSENRVKTAIQHEHSLTFQPALNTLLTQLRARACPRLIHIQPLSVYVTAAWTQQPARRGELFRMQRSTYIYRRLIQTDLLQPGWREEK